MLKTYEAGYVKKTSRVFTRDEIEKALQLDLSCPTWVMWKAIASVGFCGALRCVELRSINLGSVTINDEGCWISFFHAKQRGEAKKNEFLVPFNRSEPNLCMATRLIYYMECLRKSLPDLGEKDPLFHRALKKGYGEKPLGRNTLGKIPFHMAVKMDLPEPKKYTGHGFR